MVARDENDICWGCYAQIGCYTLKTTADAQAARYAWTRWSMKTAARRKRWVKIMAAAINEKCAGDYFRWHDSGDVFSAQYARAISQVCKLTPTVKHWLPSRSYLLSWGTRELSKVHANQNMVVRPSAVSINDSPPKIEGLGRGSTSHTTDKAPKGARECPKASKGNENKSCAEAGCRLCWQNVSGASYYYHGRRGSAYVHHRSEKERAIRKSALDAKMSFVPLEDVK
jgi:hypothetical protein